MTKLTETLKKSGWVETTLGECQVGEEVVCWPRLVTTPQGLRVTRPAEWREGEGVYVSTNDGRSRRGATPVLREPRPERPEYAPGTVALIRGRVGESHVRAWKVPGQWILTGGIPLDDDVVEVVRVLLPADQDTPAVEVTDEMVERGAEACYRARYEKNSYSPQWDEVREEYPDIAALHRRDARATLEAALEVEK